MTDATVVVNLVLNVTKDGPVSQWVDRIGIIAEKAGMDLSSICWQGDPKMVAFHVWEEASRCFCVQKVIDACK